MTKLPSITPEKMKSNICSDEDLCTIISDGSFVSIAIAEGDIQITCECTSLPPQEKNKLIEWAKKIGIENSDRYYTDDLFRADMDDKIFIYKIFTDYRKHVLAGYVINKDNTNRIKLMDIVQRKLLRALK